MEPGRKAKGHRPDRAKDHAAAGDAVRPAAARETADDAALVQTGAGVTRRRIDEINADVLQEPMKIKLELRRHCIETEAKKQYERLIRLYMKEIQAGGRPAVLEQQIEGLRFLLTHADFGRLRSAYPALSGNRDNPVTVEILGMNQDMKITLQEEVIRLFHPDQKQVYRRRKDDNG